MADDSDLDFEPRIDGPIRRNLGLIAAVVAVLVIGPGISRVLKSYRGVVLEVRDGDMLVGLADLPPKWMTAIGAEPGVIIDKAMWSWSAAPAPPRADDRQLLELYARYTRTYRGTIVEVLPPASQGGTATAVVHTDAGEREVVKLVAEHLLSVSEGDRVEKTTNRWDPVIVERPAGDGDGASLAPSD